MAKKRKNRQGRRTSGRPSGKKSGRSLIQKIYSPGVLTAVQFFANAVLLITLKKLDIIPTAIYVVICIVSALLLFLMFFLMKRKKGRVRLAKCISVILSFIMLFISLYITQTNAFLNNITGANEQTYEMSVIVMKDSKYDKLKDLKGKTYGIAQNVDFDNINLTIKAISKKQGALKVETSSSMATLADDLYSGKADAIIINEAQRKLLSENHKKFNKQTKVIWTYRITQKMKDNAKRVDVTKDAFTVYISGIDARGSVTKASRSDVNMLVTVNPNTREILLTSIPRDYYVTLATSQKKDKLTHAGIYGVEESRKTVENLLGVDVNYYIKVNFSSAENLIDAIGGVDIYSDKDFIPRADKSLHISQGTQHMDGRTAVAFARERYSYAEGDNHRVKNQQDVMKAMIRKVSSPKIIKNYSAILSSVDNSFATSMKASDLKKLAKMQIRKGGSWKVYTYQLTGTGSSSTECYSAPGSKLYVMEPNEETVKAAKGYIIALSNGEKVEIEKAK